jgi:hypothetical protein
MIPIVLLAAASLGQAALQACGDKFFLVGRGDRFARAYASLYPGRIVLYTGGGSATSRALGDGRLQKYLARAGHRVSVIGDTAGLEAAMKADQVDLILAGLSEAIELVPRVDATASRPALVPVAGDKPDKPAASPHQFAAALKASDKINGFLARIEDVMKARSAAARRDH